MKKLWLAVVIIGMTYSTYGQVWVGTDAFGSLNTTNWSTSAATDGFGTVSVTGGKVVYTSINNVSNASGYLIWNQSPTTSTNWLTTVDVHVSSLTLTTNQYASASLYVTKAGDFGTYLNEKLSINLNGLQLVSSGQSVTTTLTDVTLGIGYNVSTGILTSYYDLTGSSDGYQWTTLNQINVSSWGNSFNVAIGGQSEYFNVSSGQITLDNFSIQSVPEPSQLYLTVIGGILLTLATVKRNQKQSVTL